MNKQYYPGYDTPERFVSYYHQINFARKCSPKSVLILGKGNNLVSEYLKGLGIRVTTLDCDKKVNPDFIGDLRNLPFKNQSFDVVIACEVLNRIPFEDLGLALSEIRRVTKKKVVISIPFSSFFLTSRIKIHLPWIYRELNFAINLPHFCIKPLRGREHYWEMGRQGYSKKRLRATINKYFKIEKEFQEPFNPYHYFFILSK